MKPRTRKAWLAQLERAAAFAPRGKKQERLAQLKAERLADLRAAADRTRGLSCQ
jgi:hypothetical protein